jgi:hypothetical protein
MVKPVEMPNDGPSLKKALHEKIERLSADRLSLLNRVLLQLEAEELAQRLDEAFDEDRRAGKLTKEHVQQVLSKIRAEYPYR